LTADECLKQLETDRHKGLTQAEVTSRLAKFGHNELKKKDPESIWEKIKEQFEDLLVRLLLLAALISFVLSHFEDHSDEHAIPPWVEPTVIITILLLNGFVGIYQDLDAEKALEALKDLQSTSALVLRDGKWNEQSAKDLVPGDIIEISQGNKIPADLKMIELKTITMKIDQSILTGEATAVNKVAEPVT
jgi:P-type Ca2+ transporter type 2C